ncbi:MAG: hypothetical protein AAF236_07720, partial [Verrucomicrobiota bacterium]
MPLRLHLSLFLLATVPMQAFADWPQWRGPERNGIAASSASLPPSFDEETAPSRVWELSDVPSDHYGGHGSLAV